MGMGFNPDIGALSVFCPSEDEKRPEPMGSDKYNNPDGY
jgi:hypothetical protein